MASSDVRCRDQSSALGFQLRDELRRDRRQGAFLALDRVGILEAMPGQHAHDHFLRADASLARQPAHTGHARRRGGLAEDALELDDPTLRVEDLVIADRFDQAA